MEKKAEIESLLERETELENQLETLDQVDPTLDLSNPIAVAAIQEDIKLAKGRKSRELKTIKTNVPLLLQKLYRRFGREQDTNTKNTIALFLFNNKDKLDKEQSTHITEYTTQLLTDIPSPLPSGIIGKITGMLGKKYIKRKKSCKNKKSCRN